MLYYPDTFMHKLAGVHLLYFPAQKQVVETKPTKKKGGYISFNNNNNGNVIILSNVQYIFNRLLMF